MERHKTIYDEVNPFDEERHMEDRLIRKAIEEEKQNPFTAVIKNGTYTYARPEKTNTETLEADRKARTEELLNQIDFSSQREVSQTVLEETEKRKKAEEILGRTNQVDVNRMIASQGKER